MLPLLANEFVWREAPEHLQTTREIIGGDEVCEMLPELVVRLVVETFDGRLLDRPIHPLDLTVRPWVTWFGQAVLDIEIGTGQFKGMAAEQDFFGTHRLDIVWCPAVTGRIGEMRAVIRHYRVDPIRHRSRQHAQEVARYPPRCLFMQFDKREFRCPVDRDEQVKAPSLGSNLGQIDMEVADRIALEL